jgi:hypothetical protein
VADGSQRGEAWLADGAADMSDASGMKGFYRLRSARKYRRLVGDCRRVGIAHLF